DDAAGGVGAGGLGLLHAGAEDRPDPLGAQRAAEGVAVVAAIQRLDVPAVAAGRVRHRLARRSLGRVVVAAAGPEHEDDGERGPRLPGQAPHRSATVDGPMTGLASDDAPLSSMKIT